MVVAPCTLFGAQGATFMRSEGIHARGSAAVSAARAVLGEVVDIERTQRLGDLAFP